MDTKKFLQNNFHINSKIIEVIEKAEKDCYPVFRKIDKTVEYNQYKVIYHFQKNKLSDIHFNGTTGYGYGDIGRETIEKIYAGIFAAEDALVRPQIVSGTHAIALCLFGNLKPNEELISACGRPYDTLEEVIGIKGEGRGSLKEYGVIYKEIPLLNDGKIDIESVKKAITSKTKMVMIQRSKGYDYRKSLKIEDIEKAIGEIKKVKEDVIIFVDNCYGEFTEIKEPTEVGADIIAGSLIKNIGGGIAPTGGYVVGKKELVENASYRLYAPGIGKEVGPSLDLNRLILQGLFFAPQVVGQALKGAALLAKIMSDLGYEVTPKYDEERTDIVQAIKFKTAEELISFIQGIQMGSPVDSHVIPEPWDMPGYQDKVIMAAGGFIQGSSIELSADAPIREPYIAYVQGGLTYPQVKLAIAIALNNIYKEE
ncbi:methionine gamma-lyase family protein [Thermoanaerobacter thermohydrosulfuricus]|uniref:Cystathionine beta-lyase family protein involved in aluminum resistance n=1 Tax=Thermoanaerobacter thermohydrosulfuricus WC1 TaxID=1198630 RepID=M8DV29_THETY|nr:MULTISPECIES: methionine gamma-lyase family protein [Thermoanaerobacter]EMT40306.1 Cystathionine beta-lyase family protein involved in aluminum resistance [Thermoanaerobacter thermohydrosulfuricus WC1]UZQ84173.1 methionine gamma-lyase family protein [Thermoanaerobacter sp. RKWS2]SFE22114.1 Cystathionine beta-lyase family protein involved in aluminum resistance [Thermoanaerobacter thermohydrosulfuricus]